MNAKLSFVFARVIARERNTPKVESHDRILIKMNKPINMIKLIFQIDYPQYFKY
jgi:hypothetical protein